MSLTHHKPRGEQIHGSVSTAPQGCPAPLTELSAPQVFWGSTRGAHPSAHLCFTPTSHDNATVSILHQSSEGLMNQLATKGCKNSHANLLSLSPDTFSLLSLMRVTDKAQTPFSHPKSGQKSRFITGWGWQGGHRDVVPGGRTKINYSSHRF